MLGGDGSSILLTVVRAFGRGVEERLIPTRGDIGVRPYGAIREADIQPAGVMVIAQRGDGR